MGEKGQSASGSGVTDPPGAVWAAPLERFDVAWQALEARLCAAVLIVEVASLTLWITLRGLSTDYIPGGNAGGLLCRSLLSAALFGGVTHLATRHRGETIHRRAVATAFTLGLFVVGRLWAHVGVLWASNLLNCLQNASVLMLVGGLRGLATRLTLWVALLGASLATSRGKHIHVDVLIRYVPVKLRVPTAIVGSLAAAVVCAVAVFGFVDYIGIAAFRVSAMQPCPGDSTKACDTPTGEKLAAIGKEMSSDLFLLGRQASLDLRSVPRVLVGTPYDKWMTAAEWNSWLDGADWTAHFDKSAIAALHMDPSAPDATRMPQITVPGTGEDARGLLIRELNFVFPFGLAIIALKFLLRIVLIISGHVRVDPEAELDDEALTKSHERDDEAAAGVST
jgi:TRAP-type C4-dicarboxylate transport system permease small subunit